MYVFIGKTSHTEYIPFIYSDESAVSFPLPLFVYSRQVEMIGISSLSWLRNRLRRPITEPNLVNNCSLLAESVG